MVEQTVRTAGQVARLLGVPESTLRAWHRRYGVGPQAPRPGGYRRYTDEDVARLRRMHALIRDGALPSDAARLVSGAIDGAGGSGGAGRTPAHVLPELLGATRELDSRRCRALLEQAMVRHGVVALWEDLCRPALVAIDDEQRTGHDVECVEQEHVLSWAISATLHRAVANENAPPTPAVLLACVDGEQHTLPLEALAAALSERGVPVRMLGAAVPAASVVHAVATAGPAAVVLWAQRPQPAATETMAALRTHAAPRIAAGPGWPTDPAGGIVHVSSLPEALSRLVES